MWQFGRDILPVFNASGGEKFIQQVAARRPVFVLTVAYSATVTLPGVSGAGTTHELRELTAAADAEILAHGQARCLPGGVPSNPTGAPGPSIITRAAFDLLPDLPYICVDAGLKIAADVPGIIKLSGANPAAAVTTGQALGATLDRAQQLFESGLVLGEKLGQQYADEGYLILAESVPGGTTTALGLLLGLGLSAENRVSSSMPDNSHNLKLRAVQTGLAAVGATKGTFINNPLGAAQTLGDPMQPAVAGLALGAAAYCPVALGGGTQMAAVLALAGALAQNQPMNEVNPENLAVITTRWVSADPTADLAGLCAEIADRYNLSGVSCLSANLDFSASRYEPMSLYEQGYVKEGVGAGAAAFAAMLARQISAADLLPDIERVYEKLVLGQGNE
jgi:uncharacterized protein (TIGR00303 family)